VRWLRGQIFVGSANGTVTALYSPASSVRGVKLCIARPAKRAEPADSLQYSPDMLVITPHALPLFRDTTVRNRDRRMEKLRKDAIMSHKPGARQAHTASISLSVLVSGRDRERETEREGGYAHMLCDA
jgi:NADPH-dependent ferric siderophore reductase